MIVERVRKAVRFVRWYAREQLSDFRAQDIGMPHLGRAKNVAIISPHRLTAGEKVFIDYGSYLHCGDAAWCPDQGCIELGEGTYIGPQCVLFGMGDVRIGRDVMVSPNCVISSVQHPYRDRSVPMYHQPRVYAPITIEDDVYLGSNVVVTPGVRVGRGAVVGAGAVITKDIEPYSIALGVPAKVVATREDFGETAVVP